LIAQAVGAGLLQLHAPNDQAALAALAIVRAELQRTEGSLVVLQAAPEIKRRFDVWGYNGDALPLMRRIKQQFDPNGILNPGRFLRF
jgi:glycolate oxidase FAD binding subunit